MCTTTTTTIHRNTTLTQYGPGISWAVLKTAILYIFFPNIRCSQSTGSRPQPQENAPIQFRKAPRESYKYIYGQVKNDCTGQVTHNSTKATLSIVYSSAFYEL